MNVLCKLTRRIVLYGIAAALLGFVSPALPNAHAQITPPGMYPGHTDAKSQIHYALITAHLQNKRVLVDFGSNSCKDCDVLNTYFRDSRNHQLLKYNYVVAYINVGPNFDQNLNIAKDYGVSLQKGVPTLVVLDTSGHAIHTQKKGEFANLQQKGPGIVTAFLEEWKPRTVKTEPSPGD